MELYYCRAVLYSASVAFWRYAQAYTAFLFSHATARIGGFPHSSRGGDMHGKGSVRCCVRKIEVLV